MEKYDMIRPSSHEEWLAERNRGIGSSEIAAIMGKSRFQTAYDIYARKTGVATTTEEESPIMTMGHLLEPYVAGLFGLASGAEIDPDSAGDWIARSKDKPYMQASPDRIYTRDGARGIVECKTTALSIDPDALPEAWVMQLTWQMGITGIHEGALAWLNRTSGRFGYSVLAFDAGLFGAMEEAADRFWNGNVLAGIPPEAATEDELQRLYPAAEAGKRAQATGEVEDVMEKLRFSRDMADYYKKDAEALAVVVKAYMADADTLVDAGGAVIATWKTRKGGTRFDDRRFKDEHPDLYGQYVKQSADTRVFSIK